MVDAAEILAPYKSLREAGFPKWHIEDQVSKHLDRVKALPDGTPGKEKAIERLTQFLQSLQP